MQKQERREDTGFKVWGIQHKSAGLENNHSRLEQEDVRFQKGWVEGESLTGCLLCFDCEENDTQSSFIFPLEEEFVMKQIKQILK